MKRNRILLVIGVLILVGFLIYSPRLGYRFPIHLDEWIHVDWAVHAMDKQSYMEKDDLFTKQRLPVHEVGFHIFLSEIFLMSSVDPVLGYKYLASFLNMVTAFLLFVVIFKITKDFYTGIFAMLFFASLRNNINILGTWFFVPFVFCFPLIYLLSFSIIKGLDDKKFLIISIFILFVIYFIHVQIAIFCSLLFVVYLIFNYKKVKKNWIYLLPVILVPLIILLFYSSVLWNGSFLGLIKNIITRITFEGYGPGPQINYSLFSFYGIIAYVLAGIGIIFGIKKIKERFWIMWIFLAAIFIFIFHQYRIILLAAYRRMVYLALIGLIPLSAIGLSNILTYLKKKIKNNRILQLTSMTFIVVVFIFSFWGYYRIPSNVRIFYLINEQEYEAIEWLEEKYSSYNVVFAPKWFSEAIYPVSRNYVDYNKIKGGADKKHEFYDGDCKTKLDIIKEFKVDFVFVKERIHCRFLELVYNNSVFIYEFKDRDLTE